MSHYRVGCDAHKRYSQFAILDQAGNLCTHARVDHEPGAVRAFPENFLQGIPVALESIGTRYSRNDCVDRRRDRSRRLHFPPDAHRQGQGFTAQLARPRKGRRDR